MDLLNSLVLPFFNSYPLNNFQIINFCFLLTYLLIVSIIDLKTKETPYFLSFPLIGSGIISNIIYIAETGNFDLILNFILASLISFFKYRIGLWGGGDFLVFIGTSLFLNLIWPFFGNFFIFLISLYLGTLIYNTIYLLFIYFLKLKLQNIYDFLFIILTSFLFFTKHYTISFLILALWLLIILNKLDLTYFTKKITINNAKEEDWLAYPVFKNNKIILDPRNRPYGLTKEDIEFLKKKKVEFIYIKDGIPYLPVFFIALLLTYLIYSINFDNILYFFIFG